MMTGLRKYVALGVMMAFFAVLALDIAVPALVLSVMAAINWLVLKAPDDLFDHLLPRLSVSVKGRLV
ncbi:hypothetical protein GOZ90_05875 [Agrobacterium vitis]|uniref:Uncharacterized protein n=1 Tax=Agrobacterium vitis TaxID=373 RepID=A0A6A9UKT7_AGRVI|nr:hypothetical protein [Agrobacterium vitis]MCE6077594.1 hypothetical protein [Agrobacterium vitis]MCM2451483.1 hypothetical protein [Agrobacterium vitis]MCM2470445.1 hypothetical protein [Agrobacterium vitis]MUO72250.1 hypothetical protein [Agrobacterium vitis]MUO87252.1 hypothetical protein [Agrobacterium vitis]